MRELLAPKFKRYSKKREWIDTGHTYAGLIGAEKEAGGQKRERINAGHKLMRKSLAQKMKRDSKKRDSNI